MIKAGSACSTTRSTRCARAGALGRPDPALRAELRAEIGAAVLPAWGRFYAEYSEVRFSKKNAKEYLRWSPDAVRRVIDVAVGRPASRTRPPRATTRPMYRLQLGRPVLRVGAATNCPPRSCCSATRTPARRNCAASAAPT